MPQYFVYTRLAGGLLGISDNCYVIVTLLVQAPVRRLAGSSSFILGNGCWEPVSIPKQENEQQQASTKKKSGEGESGLARNYPPR